MVNNTFIYKTQRVAFFSFFIFMSGCATKSPNIGSDKVSYGNSKEVETLTNEFGLTDLQILAESMTSSLVTSEFITSQNSPTFTMQDIKNKTNEYIDTKAITNKLRIKLQKSKTIKFMSDASDEATALSELQRQNQSGRYNKKKSTKIGLAEGAKFRLYGEITSIEKRTEDIKNIDYILTLQVEDLETSEIVWTDEKEIRKTSIR